VVRIVTTVIQRGDCNGIQGMLNCEDDEMFALTFSYAIRHWYVTFEMPSVVDSRG
jgi:hypothetical protein